jgi:hypothetical protein
MTKGKRDGANAQHRRHPAHLEQSPFLPRHRVVKVEPQPRLSANASSEREAAIRQRIAAHFHHIIKGGRLEIEDQRGETTRGQDTTSHLADQ